MNDAAPDGVAAREPSAPALPDAERRRRNAAVLLIVLGLIGLALAGLGLVLLEVTAERRSDYTGVETLVPPAGAEPADASPRGEFDAR